MQGNFHISLYYLDPLVVFRKCGNTPRQVAIFDLPPNATAQDLHDKVNTIMSELNMPYVAIQRFGCTGIRIRQKNVRSFAFKARNKGDLGVFGSQPCAEFLGPQRDDILLILAPGEETIPAKKIKQKPPPGRPPPGRPPPGKPPPGKPPPGKPPPGKPPPGQPPPGRPPPPPRGPPPPPGGPPSPPPSQTKPPPTAKQSLRQLSAEGRHLLAEALATPEEGMPSDSTSDSLMLEKGSKKETTPNPPTPLMENRNVPVPAVRPPGLMHYIKGKYWQCIHVPSTTRTTARRMPVYRKVCVMCGAADRLARTRTSCATCGYGKTHQSLK
jgi:hypothetical protein